MPRIGLPASRLATRSGVPTAHLSSGHSCLMAPAALLSAVPTSYHSDLAFDSRLNLPSPATFSSPTHAFLTTPSYLSLLRSRFLNTLTCSSPATPLTLHFSTSSLCIPIALLLLILPDFYPLILSLPKFNAHSYTFCPVTLYPPATDPTHSVCWSREWLVGPRQRAD